MSAQQLKAVATGKSENPVAAFSGFLDKFKPQMALALPKHLNPDRMARLAVTAFSTSEKLQACEPKSIVASIMTASVLGLEIGVAGQGFLVPYGRTCTFVPGWMGLVDLVNRSGQGTVYTGVIFKDQRYSFSDGAKRDLAIHNETEMDAADDITHAYAIGWVKGASMPIIELWGVTKIKKHRDKYNKQGTKHYSFRDWEMYARKVPLLQVIKYMPKSIELARAVEVANAAEVGDCATIDGDFVTVSETQLPQERIGESVDQSTGEITREPVTDSGPPAFDHDGPAQRAGLADGSLPPVFTLAQVQDAFNKADTIDKLNDAALMIDAIGNRQHKKEATDAYKKRAAEIEFEANKVESI